MQQEDVMSTFLGSISAASTSALIMEAVLIPVASAVIGGVVGFYVNRLLKGYYNKIDKKGKDAGEDTRIP